MEPEMFHLLQVLGAALIALGAIFLVAPLLLERLPSLENAPWIILYVYRKDGFTFVTSPILIIISVLFLLLRTFIPPKS